MNLETNWMSKSELRDYLGFSMGKIETMMKSNELPYYKVGKNVKFKKELVEELSELVGIEYSMISGLEKSPKIDLKRLVDILKEE